MSHGAADHPCQLGCFNSPAAVFKGQAGAGGQPAMPGSLQKVESPEETFGIRLALVNIVAGDKRGKQAIESVLIEHGLDLTAAAATGYGKRQLVGDRFQHFTNTIKELDPGDTLVVEE